MSKVWLRNGCADSKKGPNAGRKFYVCTRYPECIGKVAIGSQEGDEMTGGAMRTSRRAITSMCLGVIGLLLVWSNVVIFVVAILALLLGGSARRDIKSNTNVKGMVYVHVGTTAAAITLIFVIVAELSGTEFVF